MQAAATQARGTGKPVAVDTLTTETQQIIAQPKGGFSLADNTQPVRTRQNNAWVPIGTTLHRTASGALAPAATAYGTLTLSGGGTGTLAITNSGATSYAVSWPTTLPAPTVSGSTATYPDVLPGVDLAVTATITGGFSEVLVVKTAAAAKNPALGAIHLTTTVTHGRLDTRNGGITMTGTANDLALQATAPTMWDSNTSLTAPHSHATTPSTPPSTAPIGADNSDVHHAGLAARIAAVGEHATPTALDLSPDTGLLTNPATVFPVYIDPTFNWHPTTGGTPAFDEVKQGSPCNHVPYFNDAGADADNGFLGVGVNGWDSCIGIQHSYYQWYLPPVIWGSHINTAAVEATKSYSAACTDAVVNLHLTGGIGTGTDWNTRPGYGNYSIAHDMGASYNPTYCPHNGTVSQGFDVTTPLAGAAAARLTQITVDLAEDDLEAANNDAGFSRFTDNPTLQIFYNLIPNTPTTAQLSAKSGADNAGCATATPYPYMGKTIAQNTPVLTATVSDPDGDQLQASYKYWIDGSSTTNTGVSADNVPSGSNAQFSLPSSFTSGLSNGQIVDWQAQVTDGEDWSGWSPVCHFIAEPTAPTAPAITSADGSYPNTDQGGTVGAHSGTAGGFTLSATSGGTTSFVYGLDQEPATSNPPASQIVTATAGVAGTPADRWKLADGTGTTATDSAGSHPITLSGGYTWSTAHNGAVTVNGSTGSGATAASVLDTTGSFTVSAWVDPSSLSGWSTFAVQQATTDSGLYLEYDGSTGRWSFSRALTDTTNPTVVRAESSAAAATNTWTHLTGVYDATSGAMTLYVNGTAVGTATDTTPIASTGPLVIGRGYHNGAAGNWAAASISDVQTYARALTAAEVGAIDASATVSITPESPGPHTVYAYAKDPAGDISGYQTYRFLSAADPTTTCASLAACFNNTAISPDNATTEGNIDGYGNSLSATALTNAGWGSGGNVTLDGAKITLPAFGSGQADNVLAANQTITYSYPVPASGASSLEFLATSTFIQFADPGAINQDTTTPYVQAGYGVSGTWCFDSTTVVHACPASGSITYTDGTSVKYYLTVPDWLIGQSSIAAVNLPDYNTPTGQSTANTPKLFPFSVPLAPGKTVASVTLPDVANRLITGQEALHIFGMATRNTTTASAPSAQTWTGTWADPTETQAKLTTGNFSNQTVRIAVKPSLSGNTVRVKLDDSLGTSPLSIGHATIAVDSGSGNPSPAPAAATTNLTFGSNPSVTIPEGGMVYSDPLPFTVTADQYLLISYQLTNSVPWLVQHSRANTAYEYVAAVGSGDTTTDTTGTPFTGTGTYQGNYTDVVTNVDVATASNVPTEAVLGDGLIDAWQPNSISDDTQGLSDDLVAAEPTTPDAFGVIAEGIEANQVMTDNPQTYAGDPVGGPSALSRIDRDILDQPNLTTVVLYEGLEDVLAGRSASDLDGNGYTGLINYLYAYGINVIVIGLTPCDGYAGDGASTNDPCTSAVDTQRRTVNTWLSNDTYGLSPWTTPSMFYLDPDAALGVTDTSNSETKLHTAADNGDHVNLTKAGYANLASTYLGPQNTWQLTDGTVDSTTTTATDTASNASPFLVNNTLTGTESATLAGGATWATDTTRGGVLALDGSSGEADTPDPVLTTSGSYSVSAWVKPTSTSAPAVIVSQDGTHTSAFALGFDSTTNQWALSLLASDTTNATNIPVTSGIAPVVGSWTDLAATYNAATHTASLYVNGTLAGTATDTTPWNATGPLVIGRAKYNDANAEYFPGQVSDVQAWNYTLSPTQITALYQQIN